MPKLLASPKERIRQRSIISEKGCWEWQMRIDRHGYGHTKVGGKCMLAHRASYEAFVGSIPTGMTIDHLCRNTKCVNPEHLEPVTNKENILRGFGITAEAARKTSCSHGHPFDAGNTRISKRGYRLCIECSRIRQRKSFKIEGWSNA